MKILLGCVLFFVVAAWAYARYLALPSALEWLRAESPGKNALWDQVRKHTAVAAERLRLKAPELLVIPDFSPNAVVFQNRGRTTLCLTDGLVRVLNSDELDSILSLCLSMAQRPGWARQSSGALLFFPFARWLQGAPVAFRVFLSPVLAVFLRLFSRGGAVYAADEAAAKMHSPWRIAASLQKLSVLGRKMPPKRWNLALDSLFAVGPYGLDEGPQWFQLVQPSVPDRRDRLLGPSCESPASLP